MNIWDYFEEEAKKCVAKCSQLYQRLLVKDFSSNWSTLTIHILASWNDHLLTFEPNYVHEKKRLL